MNRGTVFGVGVGPGDPELMTKKAVRLIENCDVLAIPHADPKRCTALRIAEAAAPQTREKPIVPIDMPMTRDEEARQQAYEAGAATLIKLLDAGKTVVFLTLGDPTVYSTYGYLHAILRRRGYDSRLVPGVPSFCAAAAALSTPLCQDLEALHILPGSTAPEHALALSGAKVVLKGNVAAWKEALTEKNVTVSAVENCGMAGERHYFGASVLPEDAGYFTVTIVKENPV